MIEQVEVTEDGCQHSVDKAEAFTREPWLEVEHGLNPRKLRGDRPGASQVLTFSVALIVVAI